jgi:cytochrome c-type biogenesis protein CcmH/NrfF
MHAINVFLWLGGLVFSIAYIVTGEPWLHMPVAVLWAYPAGQAAGAAVLEWTEARRRARYKQSFR